MVWGRRIRRLVIHRPREGKEIHHDRSHEPQHDLWCRWYWWTWYSQSWTLQQWLTRWENLRKGLVRVLWWTIRHWMEKGLQRHYSIFLIRSWRQLLPQTPFGRDWHWSKWLYCHCDIRVQCWRSMQQHSICLYSMLVERRWRYRQRQRVRAWLLRHPICYRGCLRDGRLGNLWHQRSLSSPCHGMGLFLPQKRMRLFWSEQIKTKINFV